MSGTPRIVRRSIGSRCTLASLVVAFAVVGLATPTVRADDTEASGAPQSEAQLERARDAFKRGAALVAQSDWAAALDAFQESLALREHSVTRYNLGVVQRALGQYTRARASLRLALGASGDATLPEAQREQAEAMLAELEAIVVRVALRVTPAKTGLAVDGRPLEVLESGELVGGTRPMGKGAPIKDTANIVLDPGPHVFLFSRQGFSDAVVNRSFRPGSKQELAIELDKLPATIHVDATEKQARVRVDGLDVGFAPVDVPRPAGTYVVDVTKKGHVPFSTRVTLEAGGSSRLRAPLPARQPALVERWWFWTGAGVIVASVAVGTYFATREEPKPTPPDGGTIGWAIDLR